MVSTSGLTRCGGTARYSLSGSWSSTPARRCATARSTAADGCASSSGGGPGVLANGSGEPGSGVARAGVNAVRARGRPGPARFTHAETHHRLLVSSRPPAASVPATLSARLPWRVVAPSAAATLAPRLASAAGFPRAVARSRPPRRRSQSLRRQTQSRRRRRRRSAAASARAAQARQATPERATSALRHPHPRQALKQALFRATRRRRRQQAAPARQPRWRAAPWKRRAAAQRQGQCALSQPRSCAETAQGGAPARHSSLGTASAGRAAPILRPGAYLRENARK